MNALPRLLAAVAAVASPLAFADAPDQRYWLRLDAFQADIDTRVRVDDAGAGLAGTEFSFERYGMPARRTLPALSLGARLGENWRVELGYLHLARNGSTTLDRTIQFGDVSFPVQATLDSTLRSDIYRASVGWSFLHTPRSEMGVSLGVHVTDFDIQLRSVATGGGGLGTTTTSDRREATVPLPMAGLYGHWALTDRWAVSARADVFSLRHRGYDGRLSDAQALVLYRFTPNVALGAGYRWDDYRLSSENSHLQGELDYTFKGPQLTLDVGF